MSINYLEKNPNNPSSVPSSLSHVNMKVKSKMALSIALVVAAVLLIVAALVTLFVLPHFGIQMSPLLGLLAIPVLVGLVKMAIAIFILHKPEKKELAVETKAIENYFIKAYDEKGKGVLTSLSDLVKASQSDNVLVSGSSEKQSS